MSGGSSGLRGSPTLPDDTNGAERLSLSRRRGATGIAPMCDYSLQNVKTRPAKIGDKLFTRRFSSGTGGFSAPEDINVAVCLLPGTEPAPRLGAVGHSRAIAGWPMTQPHRGAMVQEQFRLRTLELVICYHSLQGRDSCL